MLAIDKIRAFMKLETPFRQCETACAEDLGPGQALHCVFLWLNAYNLDEILAGA
jgi:hypothetical protein